MKKIKFLLLLLALVLPAKIGQNTLVAQESLLTEQLSPVETAYAHSNNDSELTEIDLETFVDLAFSEEITVSQTQNFYERLSNEQKEEVSDLVAIKAGISLEDWRHERQLHENRVRHMSSASLVDPPNFEDSNFITSELWRQPIENKWVWGNDLPPNSTFAYWYWLEQYCEGSNPDPDWDWVFIYFMDYSMNPDGLRWTSLSSQVYLAFMVAYGGNLNGYAYNWNEVRLCIGTGGVNAAGGPDMVKNGIFLHPNN